MTVQGVLSDACDATNLNETSRVDWEFSVKTYVHEQGQGDKDCLQVQCERKSKGNNSEMQEIWGSVRECRNAGGIRSTVQLSKGETALNKW